MPRVFWGTGDGWLICVEAATGRPCDGFGAGGRVDLMDGLPHARRGERDYLNALLYSVQSPPIVVRDVVITPASIADRRVTKEAVPGWIRAWDVRTGALRWVFHTVPVEGEAAAATWKNESWRYSGNTNVWTSMSADPELGYVYLPLGTATNDFYGGHRLGDNLYSESLVCLDATTGEKVWHFQVVHHGLWDYDLPAAPNLIDITVGGKKIAAVAQVTKQGFTLVFDRTHRRAGVADRGTAGAADHHARRRGGADAALAHAPAAVRVQRCAPPTISPTSRPRSAGSRSTRWRRSSSARSIRRHRSRSRAASRAR